MIISVHMPKTAGTSFYKSLEFVYGNNIYRDYSDTPINTHDLKRNTNALINRAKNQFKSFDYTDCIHGHFLPFKYKNISSEFVFTTWLRHPVERIASHYYYWKKTYDKNKSLVLHRRIVEEDWTLEKFLFSKEMQNIYAKFLWNFPLTKFSFIGITEHYKSDLNYFNRVFLGNKAPVFNENINTLNADLYINNEELRSEVEKFHAKDMQIYKQALEIRNKRL